MSGPKPLDRRVSDSDGEIRRKRSDTLIGSIRGEYPRFAPSVRADMQLGTYLKRQGYASLSDALKNRK